MVASDKTGTLTCNELTVREVRLPDGSSLEVQGEGFAPLGAAFLQGRAVQAADNTALFQLARTAVLCNEAALHHRDGDWVWRGDPTDVALLSFGQKVGMPGEEVLDKHPQVNEDPV